MAYEVKPGTFSIFKNERKDKETQPDYKGNGKLESGEEVELALWLRESKNGKKYFSGKISAAREKGFKDSDFPSGPRVEAPEDELPF